MATRKAVAPKRAASKSGSSAGGRPRGFKPEFIEQARKLCELGATDQEVADFFKVSARTLYRWKLADPELCQSLKLGKELPDERVKRSLYAAATGYEHDDTDIRVVGGKIVKTKIRRHYPPNVVACIFWLKNRDQDNWREKPGEGGGTLEDAALAAQEAIAAAMATSGSPS